MTFSCKKFGLFFFLPRNKNKSYFKKRFILIASLHLTILPIFLFHVRFKQSNHNDLYCYYYNVCPEVETSFLSKVNEMFSSLCEDKQVCNKYIMYTYEINYLSF